MEFSALEMYEIVEGKDCLVICKHGTRVGGMSVTPLMAGPLMVLVEYQARYFDARLAGKSLDDAHRDALTGARIIQAGALDSPKQ